ncbi:MAG TPA: glutathionylspermidine synthase family protein [Gemmatimonadales bacterium]|nr:glutathionylspermidine synthase family protein [Gemmatimonadales bacterium]
MIATRRFDVTPSAWSDLLRALRFQYFKWDTYACGGCLVLPEAMVLSPQAHAQVIGIVEALHAALVRFERQARREPDTLRRLGIPEALYPLIAREEERPLGLARYDLFLTEDDRWMVSEFNEDVPGGFNEAVGLPDLLPPGPGAAWAGDLRAGVLDALAAYDAVALLYATGFSEDLQHMLLLERWLQDAGHATVLGSVAHLTRGFRRPRILGVPVDAAFRFYPGEWMPRLPNLATWLKLGPGLPMMNPLRHLIRQSKTVFAWWREHPGTSAADRALVERHCPRTVPFSAAAATSARSERERWVLKRAFGRMGDAVVMGMLVSEQEWDLAVAEAARAPGEWCFQERFSVRPLEFEAGMLYPAVGAFVVNGRFAGYYSRAAERPLITHQAYHVGTLVQSA